MLFATAALLVGGAFTLILGNAWGLFATLTVSALLVLLSISTVVSYLLLPRGDSCKRKKMLDDQRD
ncbi:hypothetical protein PLANPX_2314 [Lacipirellula parvula]|uniref:Uncharacterized protein n=2 Tax=Lacipirellula parvula TaxID=2650471 RepID=A0A5K7XA04_9BACT|nr:hypothetical protein PLANPX_2314 [Lacipirellula parvula]